VLLAAGGKGDPLAHPRLTVLGRFLPIAHDDADGPRLRQRFLSRHPKAALYADFADFAFWRLRIASAHLNAGFARAADLAAADVITDVSDATELIEAEGSAIAHMNENHADAVQLYATKLLDAPSGGEASVWRVTGIDPDGLDLARGDAVLRLPFAARVTTAAQLREILAGLAKQTRGR
jgi:putative heme iron utilization protein